MAKIAGSLKAQIARLNIERENWPGFFLLANWMGELETARAYGWMLECLACLGCLGEGEDSFYVG